MNKLLAAALLVLAAAAPAPDQKVSFKTKDGWTIAGLYHPASGRNAVIILAHGVGSSKGEWADLARRLADKGVGTLATDLRGHLDSKAGPTGPRDYTEFDAAGEWPGAARDLDAAARWLKARGIPDDRIALGGASIGANLAAAAAAARPKTPFLLLLSPGPDYRGVALRKPAVRTLAGASPGDAYAHQTLGSLAAAGAETFEAPSGHGVQMFGDQATLDKVVDWISVKARPARRRGR